MDFADFTDVKIISPLNNELKMTTIFSGRKNLEILSPRKYMNLQYYQGRVFVDGFHLSYLSPQNIVKVLEDNGI